MKYSFFHKTDVYFVLKIPLYLFYTICIHVVILMLSCKIQELKCDPVILWCCFCLVCCKYKLSSILRYVHFTVSLYKTVITCVQITLWSSIFSKPLSNPWIFISHKLHTSLNKGFLRKEGQVHFKFTDFIDRSPYIELFSCHWLKVHKADAFHIIMQMTQDILKLYC